MDRARLAMNVKQFSQFAAGLWKHVSKKQADAKLENAKICNEASLPSAVDKVDEFVNALRQCLSRSDPGGQCCGCEEASHWDTVARRRLLVAFKALIDDRTDIEMPVQDSPKAPHSLE